MNRKNIVIGQKVSSAKVGLSKEFRKNMTPEESVLWKHLRAGQLGGFHFRRQQIIDGFIVDFYCHAAGLVVEVDGEVHNRQVEYDAERDRILSARGLRLLRIPNQEIREDLSGVLARISRACGEET